MVTMQIDKVEVQKWLNSSEMRSMVGKESESAISKLKNRSDYKIYMITTTSKLSARPTLIVEDIAHTPKDYGLRWEAKYPRSGLTGAFKLVGRRTPRALKSAKAEVKKRNTLKRETRASSSKGFTSAYKRRKTMGAHVSTRNLKRKSTSRKIKALSKRR